MRLVVIVYRLLPFALAFWRDFRRWLFFGAPADRKAQDHERRAERLVTTLARLGPTFVKMAQLFAGRSDILAPAYAKALTRLTDQVPPVAAVEVERIILEEYGAPADELFERFDRTPLAAASLGQVHRARYENEEVVVKVLRPGVEELVAADVRAAKRIVGTVERWWPNPHVIGTRVVIEEFSVRVAEEMDFRMEAAHAVAIGANFAGQGNVWIPRVVVPMVRQRSLVLEYCAGIRVDRLDEWVRDGRVAPERVIRDVMELYARMMLVHGLFHADPHPGNVHVAPDGRIILLDFGMVVRVPLELRRELVTAIFAAIRRDADALAESFHRLGLVTSGADPPVIRRLTATLLSGSSFPVSSSILHARRHSSKGSAPTTTPISTLSRSPRRLRCRCADASWHRSIRRARARRSIRCVPSARRSAPSHASSRAPRVTCSMPCATPS